MRCPSHGVDKTYYKQTGEDAYARRAGSGRHDKRKTEEPVLSLYPPARRSSALVALGCGVVGMRSAHLRALELQLSRKALLMRHYRAHFIMLVNICWYS